MRSLLHTEWLKMRKYPAFWWIMGLTALSYPGINFMFFHVYKEITQNTTQAGQLARMALGNPFAFPEVWHTVAFFSSIFVFIPAVMVIMFITNEYTYRTHRQNIIDGWSRDQFIASKMTDVVLISGMITVLYAAIALITGLVTHDRLLQDTWGQSYYIGLFALQTFSQLSIAFMVGFFIRKAFLALGVFLFWFIILEPILVALLRNYGNDLGRYLPIELSDRLIPIPAFMGKLDEAGYRQSLQSISEHVIYTVLLTAMIWLLCFRLNRRRDLV